MKIDGRAKIINQDRFYAGLGANGLIHWWCRTGGHEFTEKALCAALPRLAEIMGKASYKDYQSPREEVLKVPTPADFVDCRYDMPDVDKYWLADSGRVKAYWSRWGLDQQTIDQHKLGYIHFCTDQGPWAGYTIPYFWHTGDGEVLVKGVHVRRDDTVAGNVMHHKYQSLKSSRLAGIFWDKAVCLPDETRIGAPLDWVFISEDERTAMCLNQVFRQVGVDQSVAAISYHKEKAWDKYLARALSNAYFKFVLQDNDTRTLPGGRTEKPGLDFALHVQNAAGRNTGIVMHPQYKQLSDMAEAEGLNAVWPWLLEQVSEKLAAHA